MSEAPKTHCYKHNCGPIVETGAVQSIWYVCRQCKKEVTKRLAEEVEERAAIKDEGKEIVPDGGSDEQSLLDMWAGIGGYPHGVRKDPDPDDYI